MKRYGKIFIMSLLSMFALAVPVFAREMTPQELGTKAKEQIPKTSYIYVIGEYAFTSEHTLTTQDVMLAARSINAQNKDGKTNKDGIYNEMTIFTVEGDYDDDTGEFTGNWKKGNNVIGTSQLGDNLNIRYIDYNYIKDIYTVTLDTDGGNQYKDPITVEEGGKIDQSLITGKNAPTKKGKQFKEWVLVKEDNQEEKWDFNKEVTGNMILKATWYNEVNTDELLKEAQNKIQKNEFYGATFENRVLTYHLYDKNKKNSEIKDTGLVGTIRDILKNENVKLLTITYDNSHYDFDSAEMNDKESEAYKKLQEVLTKVAGKNNFEEIIQGDLVGKELTLTIKLNENIVRSQDNNIEESYAIKFVYEEQATIGAEIPEKDQNELKSKFNYTPENTYEIKGQDGLYTVTGDISKQKVKGFGTDEKEGYYFAYTITLNEGVDPTKAKVRVPKGDSADDGYNEVTFDTTTKAVTVLMEVEENEETKYRDIIVEVDGVPTKIRIDFTNLELSKTSIFKVEDAKSETKLKTDYGWTAPKDYNVVYTPENCTQEGETVKVTGFLPIHDNHFDEKGPFKEEHETGYYIAFAIKTDNSKQDTTTVEIKDGEETILWKGENFDDSNTIYMLKHLHPDAETKTFTIEVDIDGEGTRYEPYTITVDWSELKLQATSKGNFGNYEVIKEKDLAETSAEFKELAGYNFSYKADENVKVILDSESQPNKPATKKGLGGTIKEQTLANGFQNNNGFFVPIKIEFPGKDIPKLEGYEETWTLILNTENGETKTYKPSPEEYEQGWVLVLFKIEKDGKQYGESQKQKVIKYQIDFDGDEIDFVPEEYTIDYSDLKFETENKITYNYKDKDGKDNTETVVVYENEIVDLKDLKDNETKYRTFDGWYKESEKVSESKDGFKTGTDEDVILTAHWNLNVDAFVKDVIENSADYSEIIDLAQAENEITMTIDKPNVKLEELAKTSIPGTIAYILEKNEITGIKLTIGNESVEFNSDYKANNGKVYTDNSNRGLLDEAGLKLKEEIVKGAKGAFDKELKNHETDATLDQLEYDNKEFTIKISSVDDTIKLVDTEGTEITDENDKTYTFKFDSDFAVVKQKPDSELGATDLAEAASSSKKYSTVYVDGDYTANAEIDITANHDVTIMPMTKPEKEPTTTVKANHDSVEYAVDVQSGSGTVTIKDLKITGGKRSELRIEDGATVIVDNIDVSGKINQETATTEEMNSSIIVKGNLTATNVKNDDESYNCPTISVVTGYTKNTDPSKPEEGYPDHAVEGNAKVTANGMTKNNKFCLVDRKTNPGIHTTTERYDGAFYYNDANHSKIYYVGIMDTNKTAHPYDYIQVYYYGEKINLEGLGYKMGETPLSGSDVFLYFEVGKVGSGNKIEDTNTLAQDKLNEHTTTILHAIYGAKPVVALNFDKVSGLSRSGNKVYGTLSTQNEDGKFMIPVTLTSDSFQSSVSTVEVTDPNGNKQTYKYDENNENGIATVSNANTIKLELEAIKSSKITGNKGKVYEITVDVDGKEKNEVKPETYTIDYNNVETLEEIINEAAKNTQDANSLTIAKNNNIKGRKEEFNYQYDKSKNLTYYQSTDRLEEQYSFKVNSVIPSHKGPIIISVNKKSENYVAPENARPELNDWIFANFLSTVSMGSHEISLLQDMKKETTPIQAIEEVKPVEGKDHTYEVTLNKERLNAWLDNAYLDTTKTEKEEASSQEDSNTVKLEIVLDTDEKYVVSIKTIENFSITTTSGLTYKNNKIDVQFSNIGTTEIQEPAKFLAKDGQELKEEDFKNYYEACKKWHKKETGADIYEGE